VSGETCRGFLDQCECAGNGQLGNYLGKGVVLKEEEEKNPSNTKQGKSFPIFERRGIALRGGKRFPGSTDQEKGSRNVRGRRKDLIPRIKICSC